MNAKVLEYIRKCEGWKTGIKMGDQIDGSPIFYFHLCDYRLKSSRNST